MDMSADFTATIEYLRAVGRSPRRTKQSNDTFTENLFQPNFQIMNLYESKIHGEQTDDDKPFHRTIKQYRTLERASRKTILPKPLPSSSSLPPLEDRPQEYELDLLLKQDAIEQAHIYQASKALELCQSKSVFSSSCELVEAEKALLVAMLRRRAILDKISETRRVPSPEAERVSCRLCVEEISLPVKQSFLEAHSSSGFDTWFFCAASHDGRVLTTETVCRVVDGAVRFDRKLSITGVGNRFSVELDVYSLRLKSQPLLLEQRSDLQKFERQARRLPKFIRSCLHLPPPGRSGKTKSNDIVESLFKLAGSYKLCDQDLQPLPGKRKLSLVPLSSPLCGTINLTTQSSDLTIHCTHRGFLNVLESRKESIAWSLKWILLQDKTLSLWNSPEEQEDDNQLYSSSKRKQVIELQESISSKVGRADRSLCARANTFLVVTKMSKEQEGCCEDSILKYHNDSNTMIRHFFAASTREEMLEWCRKISFTISAIKSFNSSPLDLC